MLDLHNIAKARFLMQALLPIFYSACYQSKEIQQLLQCQCQAKVIVFHLYKQSIYKRNGRRIWKNNTQEVYVACSS